MKVPKIDAWIPVPCLQVAGRSSARGRRQEREIRAHRGNPGQQNACPFFVPFRPSFAFNHTFKSRLSHSCKG